MVDIKFLLIECIVIELIKLMWGINVEESFNYLKLMKVFNYMLYFEYFDMN